MAETEKRRGVLLTIWLVIMLVANFFTALSYLLLNKSITLVYPNIPVAVIYIYGLLALANLAFTISLFMWKRWALFAFCGSAVIAAVINLALGFGVVVVIFGLAGPVILYLIMRPKWQLFE